MVKQHEGQHGGAGRGPGRGVSASPGAAGRVGHAVLVRGGGPRGGGLLAGHVGTCQHVRVPRAAAALHVPFHGPGGSGAHHADVGTRLP